MKAARLFEYGRPLRVVDIPEPTVSEADDIIVKIEGAGVCKTDLNLVQGFFKDVLPSTILPFTLGHECIGFVNNVGTKPGDLAVGDCVILHPMVTCGECGPCRTGNDTFCRNSHNLGFDGTDGGYAEFLKTKSRNAVRVHHRFGETRREIATLAPLACAGLTAFHAVRRIVNQVGSNDYVLVMGVGGLGHLAIQLLKIMGISNIIALDLMPEKLKLAEELGAKGVLLFSPGDDHRHEKEIMEITAGDGVGVVLDFAGSDNSPRQALRMLRKKGTYSVIGYGGTLVAPTLQLIDNEFVIQGNLIGSYAELCELMRIVQGGKLRTESALRPLDQANEALRDLKEHKIKGRVVLVPN